VRDDVLIDVDCERDHLLSLGRECFAVATFITLAIGNVQANLRD
jgi:hypothetical protein